MKKRFFTLFLLGLLASITQLYAQEKVQFAKGKRDKTISVSLAAGAAKTYALQARGGQAILVEAKGPTAAQAGLSLVHNENVEDHEFIDGSLRILTQNNGTFLVQVRNKATTKKIFSINFFIDSAKFY